MMTKKTNRDWLNSLTNEELADWLCSSEFQILKMSFTQSNTGLAEWLNKERIEDNNDQ